MRKWLWSSLEARIAAFTLLAVGAYVACDDPPRGVESTGPSLGIGAGGASQFVDNWPCETGDQPFDVTGTYVLLARLQVGFVPRPGAPVTVCPDDQLGESAQYFVLRVQRNPEGKLEILPDLCAFDLPSVQAVIGPCPQDPSPGLLATVSVGVPDGLLHAILQLNLPPAPIHGDVKAPGDPFTTPRAVYTVGSSVPGEQMSYWAGGGECDDFTNPKGTGVECAKGCVSDCSTLADDDEDTFPGVSVTVCGRTNNQPAGTRCNTEEPEVGGTLIQGKAFINFEVNPTLTAVADNSCRLSGTIDSDINFNVIGGYLALAGKIISVQLVLSALPEFVVDPKNSRFRAVRVDGKFGTPDWQISQLSTAEERCTAALARWGEAFLLM